MNRFTRRILCGAAIVLSAASCKTSSPDRAIDPREMCNPESSKWGMCRPEYVPALPLEDLRQHGASLLVTCDFWSIVDAAYETKCREGTFAAARDLASRFPGELGPIAIDRLVFKKEGVCIDTFIPGREAADCFDYLQVSLPLDWK